MALLSGLLSVSAVALIAYLLWPTWQPTPSGQPDRLPISIGGVLFNIPPQAIREKVQRQSGPQERVDLSFEFPSLAPPGAPRHVSPDTIGATEDSISRIFLSIAEHHGAMAPQTRLQTIYPRYLEASSTPGQDGLTRQAFRDGTPYEHEDLILADAPEHGARLVARCSRDAETPGTCLSERRINGADLTFRFPRQWLSHWRDVASAMDRLVTRLHGAQE
jgi:hypothetical protein